MILTWSYPVAPAGPGQPETTGQCCPHRWHLLARQREVEMAQGQEPAAKQKIN